jgi:glutathione S-transferase
MKLFYSPGACSLSPNIVAHEAGIELRLQKVDTKTKTVAAPGDYWAINPKGYVPALELDSGEILTEGPTIVQYLADLEPAAGLAPATGTVERYRLQEMLGYLNSEIHKTYSMLFKPNLPAEVRAEREEYLLKRYALIDQRLEGRQYLFGDNFTVADAYLFTLTNWAKTVKVDLSKLVQLQKFQERVAARPAVKAAMKAEGLIN